MLARVHYAGVMGLRAKLAVVLRMSVAAGSSVEVAVHNLDDRLAMEIDGEEILSVEIPAATDQTSNLQLRVTGGEVEFDEVGMVGSWYPVSVKHVDADAGCADVVISGLQNADAPSEPLQERHPFSRLRPPARGGWLAGRGGEAPTAALLTWGEAAPIDAVAVAEECRDHREIRRT